MSLKGVPRTPVRFALVANVLHLVSLGLRANTNLGSASDSASTTMGWEYLDFLWVCCLLGHGGSSQRERPACPG